MEFVNSSSGTGKDANMYIYEGEEVPTTEEGFRSHLQVRALKALKKGDWGRIDYGSTYIFVQPPEQKYDEPELDVEGKHEVDDSDSASDPEIDLTNPDEVEEVGRATKPKKKLSKKANTPNTSARSSPNRARTEPTRTPVAAEIANLAIRYLRIFVLISA